MGNTLAKKYNITTEHSATAGHLNLWKIYNGVRNQKELSVWTFQRQQLNIYNLDKNHEEQIMRVMRNDVTCMKLYDSEGFIKAYDIIEEKDEITFATERILYSLHDLLTKFTHFPIDRVKKYKDQESISDIEISRGLLNILEGLQYLHSVQKKLHLNISPENIVVTSTSFQWKLCGFGHSLGLQIDEMKLPSPYFLKEKNISPMNKGISMEPNLQYSCPEMTSILQSGTILRYLSSNSDIFSLGLVFYEIYQFMLNPDSLIDNSKYTLLVINNNSIAEHQNMISTLKSRMQINNLPTSISFLLEGMLQLDPIRRFTIANLLSNSFFNTGIINILKLVETIKGLDSGKQASIMTSIANQITSFPPRLLEASILPAICKLCITNPSMWLYALPLHVKIAEYITVDSYRQITKDAIIIGLKSTDQLPHEILKEVLKYSIFIYEKFGSQILQESYVNLFENSLDKQSNNIQLLALQILCHVKMKSMFTIYNLCEKILPRICREACKNPDIDIKTSALYFIGMNISLLDHEYISKNIIPSLDYIISRNKTQILTKVVIGVFRIITENASLQVTCHEILPVLIPLLSDNSLSKQQFDLITRFIAYLMNKVIMQRCTQNGVPMIELSKITSFDDNLLQAFAPGNGKIPEPEYTKNITQSTSLSTAIISNDRMEPTYESSSSTSSLRKAEKRPSTSSSTVLPQFQTSAFNSWESDSGPLNQNSMTPALNKNDASTAWMTTSSVDRQFSASLNKVEKRVSYSDAPPVSSEYNTTSGLDFLSLSPVVTTSAGITTGQQQYTNDFMSSQVQYSANNPQFLTQQQQQQALQLQLNYAGQVPLYTNSAFVSPPHVIGINHQNQQKPVMNASKQQDEDPFAFLNS